MIASGRWWVSFFIPENWLSKMEIHTPWWVSGERGMDEDTEVSICVAVLADDEEHAMRCVRGCFDSPIEPEWRFVNARNEDWIPFCDRFPQDDWMQWPNSEENRNS